MAGARVPVAVMTALVVVGCSSGSRAADPTSTSTTTTTASTTTAPPRATSTTTTAYDPASVEGAVETAYLKSWDVYADAVYNLTLDDKALAEVYGGTTLDGKTSEIKSRISAGRAALVAVDHRYDVVLISATQAQVVDRFQNHQVLIDPETKTPIEDDPNELLVFNFRLDLGDDGWRVTFIQKVGS